MPFTVITLTRTPPSLRGDLSKWMQEIATGVYVGNFNVRIRERLWERVLENIGSGEATISYEKRNEIGYHFKSFQTEREMIELEGIPLVLIPNKKENKNIDLDTHFSQAHAFHKLRNLQKKGREKKTVYVIIDIETTGLNEKTDQIIEIGALKIEGAKKKEFHKIISVNSLPINIQKLTGITPEEIDQHGENLYEALEAFISFIGEEILVGYNISFDLKFLNSALKENNISKLKNKCIDLKNIAKKDNSFLRNYKLETVLKGYGIDKSVPHRALEDVKLMDKLILKVNGFEDALRKQ